MKKINLFLALFFLPFVSLIGQGMESVSIDTHHITTTLVVNSTKSTETFILELNSVTNNTRNLINNYLDEYQPIVDLVVDSCSEYINNSVAPSLRANWIESLDYRDRLRGFLDVNASPVNVQLCLDDLGVKVEEIRVLDSILIDRADSIAMLNQNIANLAPNCASTAALQQQLNDMTVQRDNCIQSQSTCAADLAQCQTDLAAAQAAAQLWQDSSNYWKALALAGGGGSSSQVGTTTAYWTYYFTQGNIAYAYVFTSGAWGGESINVTADKGGVYSFFAQGAVSGFDYQAFSATLASNDVGAITATTAINGQAHQNKVYRVSSNSSRYRTYPSLNIPTSVNQNDTFSVPYEGQDFSNQGISNGTQSVAVDGITRIGDNDIYQEIRMVFAPTPN